MSLTINKATPMITWSNPADITYGIVLSATQLNASANVAGAFTYTPATGTKLNAGANQTLGMSFAPADANNYNTANASVKINVLKATPVITWTPNPLTAITYGTNLTGKLTATATFGGSDVAGSFVYKQGATTITSATKLMPCVDQALTVEFTPSTDNSNNFNGNTATNSIAVECVSVNASGNSTPQAVKNTAIIITVKVTKATITGDAAAGVPVTLYLDTKPFGPVESDVNGIATFNVGVLPVEVYKIKAVVAACNNAEDIAYMPIYDPNGGFVTGGGWIMSPAGAYTADKMLTGKANFGFNSKYQKGSSIPTGNTKFQFKAGDLNFNSSSYDAGSLVVATCKAIYKGTGTVNGVSGYSFMVTAVDGQINGGGNVDKFRIKIWKTSDPTAIVYDNGLGADENSTDITALTALSGGSIVVQEAKSTSKPVAPTIRGQQVDVTPKENLTLGTYPNPAVSQFSLKVGSTNTKDAITLIVYNHLGQVMEVKNNLSSGQTIRVGAGYTQGIYFVEAIQGNKKQIVQVVKTN